MSRYNTKKNKNKEVLIDHYKRYQTGLKVQNLFPLRDDKKCACGCEADLPPRKRRWASKDCNQRALDHFYAVKGDMNQIRNQLYKNEKAICRKCGEKDKLNWQADHIIEVRDGGGGTGIDNFQTLCHKCHVEKTTATTRRIIEEKKSEKEKKKKT